MEDLMHKEIVQGISGTSVRAGIMKVASEGAPLTDSGKEGLSCRGTCAESHRSANRDPTFWAILRTEQHAVLVKTARTLERSFSATWMSELIATPARLKALLPLLESGSYFEVDTFGRTSTRRGLI